MPKEVEGKAIDLYRLRQARRTTAENIASLQRAGIDTTALQVTYDSLMETVVLLPVPCLVCRRNFPVETAVAEDGLPYAVLCAECDAKITTSLELEGSRVKRKRRSREEIMADRSAAKAAAEEVVDVTEA